MGRSSRQQAEQNRADILAAACRLFRERGVDNVSITDIMAAVGLTAGGFYRHFASKEALFKEALSTVFAQSTERWEQTVHSCGQHEPDAVDALIRNYFRKKMPGQTCPILAFAPHVSQQAGDPQTSTLYGSHTEALYQRFHQAAIKSAENAGTPPPSEQEIMLHFAAMVGTGFLAQSINDNNWIRTLKEAVLTWDTRQNSPLQQSPSRGSGR